MPPGTVIRSAWYEVDDADVRLLVDATRPSAPDGAGVKPRSVSRAIFDAVFAAVERAESFIVLDAFLVNAAGGEPPSEARGGRALSGELVERLIARKVARPALRVLFVTDPINDAYGGAPSPLFARLREAGVEVVMTDLERLRDSNPAYSALWRLGVGWWDRDGRGRGWLPHPLGDASREVTLRAWLRLLHFKANHRKVLACDDGAGGWTCIVSSANPHDASSGHSNIALKFHGPLARVVAEGELAVARFSGWSPPASEDWTLPPATPPETAPRETAIRRGDTVALCYLTEHAIEAHLIEELARAGPGDTVSLAMFYLSDRDVVEALLAASARGARVRLVLDPNKDAFGHEKDGVPNRQVAEELVRRSEGALEVRWVRTDGEQFHTKLTLIEGARGTWASLGSANLTRRNLDNYNLEANVALRAPSGTQLATSLAEYFAGLWSEVAPSPTAPFEAFRDTSRLRRWRYRIMEATGLSTF